MKKTILTLAIALMSMTGVSMSAQTNEICSQQTEKVCKGECKGKHGDKECKKMKERPGKPCGERKERCGGKDSFNPLMNGIDLTAEQQKKAAQLMSKMRDDMKNVKNEAREERGKLREKFNNDMLDILTPEQQAVYKENMKKMEAKREAKQQKMECKKAQMKEKCGDVKECKGKKVKVDRVESNRKK